MEGRKERGREMILCGDRVDFRASAFVRSRPPDVGTGLWAWYSTPGCKSLKGSSLTADRSRFIPAVVV